MRGRYFCHGIFLKNDAITSAAMQLSRVAVPAQHICMRPELLYRIELVMQGRVLYADLQAHRCVSLPADLHCAIMCFACRFEGTQVYVFACRFQVHNRRFACIFTSMQTCTCALPGYLLQPCNKSCAVPADM